MSAEISVYEEQLVREIRRMPKGISAEFTSDRPSIP